MFKNPFKKKQKIRMIYRPEDTNYQLKKTPSKSDPTELRSGKGTIIRNDGLNSIIKYD